MCLVVSVLMLVLLVFGLVAVCGVASIVFGLCLDVGLVRELRLET